MVLHNPKVRVQTQESRRSDDRASRCIREGRLPRAPRIWGPDFDVRTQEGWKALGLARLMRLLHNFLCFVFLLYLFLFILFSYSIVARWLLRLHASVDRHLSSARTSDLAAGWRRRMELAWAG